VAVPFATVADVEGRWRPLTDAEAAVAGTWLADASELLRLQVPSIDARVADESVSAAFVAGVVARAVLRVLRNPDGKVSESIDDYTYRRADGVADGSLFIAAEDLALLRPAGSRGTSSVRLLARGYELPDPTILPSA
jgi:hypothetical protein